MPAIEFHVSSDISIARILAWTECLTPVMTWPFLELFPKVVDRDDRSSGDSFSVDEHDAVDQVLQFLGSIQFPPA
jgi:hypothetical protein